MNERDHSTNSAPGQGRLVANKRSLRGRRGLRLVTLSVLLSVGLLSTACTPAEIEGSINRITASFEDGGVERGLADAIVVIEYAIPVIEMRLGSLMP